jgi:hypothetical protein
MTGPSTHAGDWPPARHLLYHPASMFGCTTH